MLYSPRKSSEILPFSAFVEVKFETLGTHVCVFTNICHFCLAFKEVVNIGHILCQFNWDLVHHSWLLFVARDGYVGEGWGGGGQEKELKSFLNFYMQFPTQTKSMERANSGWNSKFSDYGSGQVTSWNQGLESRLENQNYWRWTRNQTGQ